MFGGSNAPRQQTESWDGTAWSERNDMNQGRQYHAGAAANSTAGITFGGVL